MIDYRKRPCLNTLAARASEAMWPPHTPEWISINNSLTSALLMQRRRCPVTKVLYNSSPIT
jgi:hypothetical protein